MLYYITNNKSGVILQKSYIRLYCINGYYYYYYYKIESFVYNLSAIITSYQVNWWYYLYRYMGYIDGMVYQ